MVFVKKVDFSRSHFSIYYFTFVLILVLFSAFYFFESKPSTTGFATFDESQCNSQICPYYSPDSAGYNRCILDFGPAYQPLCQYCLLVYRCTNYPPDKPGGGSSGGQSSTSSNEPKPTNLEIETSKSSVLQSTSASEYAGDIVKNYLPSSGGSVAENSFVSPVCSDSSNAIECTKELLVLADKKVNTAENLIKLNLGESNALLQKYPGDSQIIKDNLAISKELVVVQEKYSQIKLYDSLVTNIIIQNAKDSANKEIMNEKQKQQVLDYYNNLLPKIPKISENIQPKDYLVSKPIQLPKNKAEGCKSPVQDMIYNSVKSGFYGLDYNGKACVKTAPPVKPYLPPKNKGNGGNSGVGNGNNNPSSTLTGSPGNSGSHGNGGNNALGVFLIDDHEHLGSINNHEAFLISRDSNNLIKIGFLLAPSRIDLEKKIADFTRELFFGESTSSSEGILGTSSASKESFKEYSRPVPWIIWVILLFVTVPFLILGKIISIDEKYLVSQGKNYLIKNDFTSAVKNYNKIIDNYDSFDIDDESFLILLSNYKNVLVKFLEEKSIPYYIQSSEVPKIYLTDKTSYYTHLSNEARVAKIIEDTKKEIKNNKRLAVNRLPIIADLYSKLDFSAKKRLAEKYEDLVYSLRD